MKSKLTSLCAALALTAATFACTPGNGEIDWQKGILESEFVYDEAPFRECHSATIAETPAGLVVGYFGGTVERHPDVCIWVSRRENGAWVGPELVADGIQNDTLRYPCWNPVLYQVPGGELIMFYKVGPSPSTWKGFLKRSFDNGRTWGEAEALPEDIVGPVKNKPELIDGRLLCPSSKEGGPGWRLYMEETSDWGKTWASTPALNEGQPWWSGIQPSILRHKRGRLQILFRTRNRRIGTAWSEDGGRTWSPLDSTLLPNNNSGIDAVTLRDGRHLLVYNHVLPPGEEVKGPRTPLNLSLSRDGVQWYASAILENSPVSQYSYPAVIQGEDGYVHVVYTWRRRRIKYAKIDPKQLQMIKIEDIEWPHNPGLDPQPEGPRFQISVCDWMMLKRQKDGAIPLAKELGYDGLEVDMNSLGDNPTFQSRFKDNPEALQAFKALAEENGIRISSVAMSGFYAQSIATRESWIEPVSDCIEVMKGLDVQVAFLPLGINSDIKAHPELRPAVVERLRTVGKMAEEAGVVIGIETSLDAAGDLALLEEIGSPAIKIYFKFQNAVENGRNIYKELRTLGAENICMIHCTNTDGVWIENDPALDMQAIRYVLEDIGYSGWLVVERSRDASDVHNVRYNYGGNCAYLHKIFN